MDVQDPEAGETALAELKGIQFGILSNEDTLALSVFERNQTIDRAKDLWDSRLGVYTLLGKDDRCGTCGAKKASDCDGHFGHINLPMAVFNPLHIRYLKKVLSQICLVCLRYKQKKESRKTGTANEEAYAKELSGMPRQDGSTPKKMQSNGRRSDGDAEVVKNLKTQGRDGEKTLSTKAFILKSKWTRDKEKLASRLQSLKTLSAGKVDAGLPGKVHPQNTPIMSDGEAVTKNVRHLKSSRDGIDKLTSMKSTKTPSRLEAAYIASQGHTLPTAELSSDDDSPTPTAFQRTSQKQAKWSLKSKYGVDMMEDSDNSDSSDIEDGCKYCGADLKDPDDRYPNLVVTLTKKNENSCEAIEMKAGAKEELVPPDYWDFVQGHPGGCKNIRPLVPFEALQILQRLSGEVIQKLGMHERVARPEALILSTLPVPPSGARIREMDSASSLPRAFMDQQHRLLQRISAEVRRLQRSRAGKPSFAMAKSEVMELQSLASHYLTGSKWEHGLRYNRNDPEVKKDDKLMKGHVLAKRNNVSARLIVVGDPSINIEEISVPIDLVEQLTIPEKVTAFSINRLQQYVNNGPHADFFKTGAVRHDRPGSPGMSLLRTLRSTTLEIGDTVHRHLKDGDLVIVNRPPSLTKHSLMAMRVRLHLGSTLAINPLICAPFQADFDGDTMHVYVPESPEAVAEVHEIMNVPNQLMNPQGGQSNCALTEDSRLGAYLITSSCVFLDKITMCQFAMSTSASLPIPAVVKCPKSKGPLWTGQQLYSMTIPRGVNYRAAHKRFTSDAKLGILVRDGEFLVCDGSSHWLGDAQDAFGAVISKTLGPSAALAHLNQAQDLANQYLRYHGFSVGLLDYQLARDPHSRSKMLNRMREELTRANREALLKMLISDEQVQRQELHKHPTSSRGFSVDTECRRSEGLYLGNTGSLNTVKALEKVAISGFQSRFGQVVEGLARDYSTQENALLTMIRTGSKGSMSKLVQQTVCLGLQLYKGEQLLPCGAHGLLRQEQRTNSSTLRITDLLRVEQGAPVANLSGYWESRGLISRSYLDGLRPLHLFIHNIASRYGLQRAGVEEPNLLLKRLLLFMRDLHVAYDGSVCNLQGRHIVQYEYGGLLEVEGAGGKYGPKWGPDDWPEAGEAVGILAATSVTEPAYQLKLDSPHMIGAKAIGPLELFNESVSPKTRVKLADRRILLRMPRGLRNRHHGQEKGATKIQQFLQPITLELVTSTTMIEYRKVEDTQDEAGEQRRKSPWVGHIRLSPERLKNYQVMVEELVVYLEKKYSKQDSHRLIFSSSSDCHFSASSTNQEERKEPCIHFFPDIPSVVATCSDQAYEDYMSALLESMTNVMLPILLQTTVKGDERILSANILWEDTTWSPRCTTYPPPPKNEYKQGNGELIVEVTIKPAHCKARGKAWRIVTEACLPIMRLLDWQRCTPYSIQEVNHIFGVEAAQGLLLQRLELAVAGMGKPVNVEHMKLIADSMTTCGEVNGAYITGYRDFCKATSTSTPFHDAAYQNHKNSFISAAREGASEHMGGSIAASVWGKRALLGTGSNFELLWQDKVGAEPLPKLQKGVDAHQFFAQLNSLVPQEQAKPVRRRRHCERDPDVPAAPVSNSTRPLLQPIRPRAHADDDDGRTSARGDAWRAIRNSHRRAQQLSRQVERASNAEQPRSCPPDLQSRAGGLFKRSRLAVDEGRASTDGPNCKRRVADRVPETLSKVHARGPQSALEQVSKRNDASHLQARSPLCKPEPRLSLVRVSVEDPPVEASEDNASGDSASSFHTPKESLEPHSATSSPCSSFRENTCPSPAGDGSASEGDQMSGISQPGEVVTTRHAGVTDSAAGEDVETRSRVPPPSGERTNRRSQHTTTDKAAKLTASDDVLERQTEKWNDEWERLLHLAKIVKHILHKRYEIGERLVATDQRLIVDKVLRNHPDYVQKIGCGVHYVKVDRHQSHGGSRCFYVVRNDKSVCDFSYHKCIKGVANAKSPLLAMQYDHEFLFKHERDNLADPELLDSYDLDPDFYPSWAPPSKPGQPVGGDDFNFPVPTETRTEGGSDLNTLVRGVELLQLPSDGCTGSRQKEASSCETSEVEPGF